MELCSLYSGFDGSITKKPIIIIRWNKLNYCIMGRIMYISVSIWKSL